MKKESILKITIGAVMAALAIVLEKFVSLDLGIMKLTFYGFPLMVVGIIGGYKMGLITGIVTGTILQLTSKYLSITSPFWALAPICWGFFSGLFYKIFKKSNSFWKLLIVVFLTSFSATIANTFAMFSDTLFVGDSYYTAATILVNLPTRLLSMIVLVVPYTILLKAINSRLKFITNEEENM